MVVFFGGIVPPPNQQDLAMADHLPTWAPSKSIDSFPNGLVGKNTVENPLFP